jgi:tRNA A-37 threonylcarbamoyl transferase component Bud32
MASQPLSVSADATLKGYAPDCIREPYLRAIGARGFVDRRVTAAIAFAEAAGRFFVALLAPEGGMPKKLTELIGKLDKTSLGDWIATAVDGLAEEVVKLPDAVARPAALALRDERGKETACGKALKLLISPRNAMFHGSDLGPDTPRAEHAYETIMQPALRDLIEGLGFVRHLPIYALDRLHPSTGRPTRLVRFVGPESEAFAFSESVGVRALEPLLISDDGRAVELGPFMAAGLSAGMGLRLQLLEKIEKNRDAWFSDPAGRGAVKAPPAWKEQWLDGTLRRPLIAPPNAALSALVTRPPGRLTGRTTHGYTFEGFIARGASASVYRGRSATQAVALKVLHTPLRSSGSHRERLRRELELLSRFNHPRIVRAHDLLEDTEHGPILVMDLAEGIDLERVFGAERASPLQATELVLQVLDALESLHAHGVVHRDIKPANVLVDGTEAMLVDFGIARDPDQDRMTGTLDRLGTRTFAAPEQASGGALGPAADLFAVGRLLAWLLTGEAGDKALGALPPGLAAWVRRATREDPTLRHAHAAAMADELRTLRAAGFEGGAPLGVGDELRGLFRVTSVPTRVHEGVWQAEIIEKSTLKPLRVWFAARGQAQPLRAAIESIETHLLLDDEGGLVAVVLSPQVELRIGARPTARVVGPVESDTAPASPLEAEGPLGLRALLPAEPEAARRRLDFVFMVAEAALRALVEGHASAVAWFRASAPGGRSGGLAARLALLEGLVQRGPATGLGMEGLLRHAMVLLPQVATHLQTARSRIDDPVACHDALLGVIGRIEGENLRSPVLIQTPEGWALIVDARPTDGARRLAAPETSAPIPQSIRVDTLRDWRHAQVLNLGMVRIDQPDKGLGGSALAVGRFEAGYDASGKPRLVVGYEPKLSGPAGELGLVTHAMPWMQHNMVRLMGFTDGLQWRWVRREGVRQLLEVADPAAWLRQNVR